jgi:predicted ATPase
MTNAPHEEIRKLQSNWVGRGPNRWPKWLNWIAIDGLRGWREEEKIEFSFPLVAICGENGVGKSTILQAAASIYKPLNGAPSYFASQFFPDTPWEKVQNVTLRYSVREGQRTRDGSVRKPSERWLGNDERPERAVQYLDLRRTQPVVAQRGYQKLTKKGSLEAGSTPFEPDTLGRYTNILGRDYTSAKHSYSTVDDKLRVTVVSSSGSTYSGFHQGAGESTVADLVALKMPRNSLILIDEIETSLHPRAQRRLIRDLAKIARQNDLQVIMTTHSPYILEELPPEARIYLALQDARRTLIRGVSPELALASMDDAPHPEADIYVEDREAARLVTELVARRRPDVIPRLAITPAGSASVIRALGIMVHQRRFQRPTASILDGDQDPAEGCIVLPGDDAPERVILQAMRSDDLQEIALQLARSPSQLRQEFAHAVTLPDHHAWLHSICDKTALDPRELWAICVRQWLKAHLSQDQQEQFVQALLDTVGIS